MPDYDYPTPNEDNDWCQFVIIIPTALRGHLYNQLQWFFIESDWVQVGDLTELEVSDLLEFAWGDMEQDCGVFLHDESEAVLTDESGVVIEHE